MDSATGSLRMGSEPKGHAGRQRHSAIAATWKPDLTDRPILPGPLRFRVALPFVLLFTVVLVVLCIVTAVAVRRDYLERLDGHLAAYASGVASVSSRVLESGERDASIAQAVDALAADFDVRITIIAADGSVIADSEVDPATMANHSDRQEVVDARATGHGSQQRSSETTGTGYLYVAVPLESPAGSVARVAAPLEPVLETVRV
ncbi:MAG TPA: hypothetical protein VD767_09575, partial [Thermomicrobiales bacterium]|nr:hypothetical protein [Thermomicrobiales bacterium]